MSECWTQLRKSWVGFSLRLTRTVEAQSTSRKSGFVEDYVIICMLSAFIQFLCCISGTSWSACSDSPVSRKTKTFSMRAPWMSGRCAFVNLGIEVFVYMCICVFMNMRICVFMYMCIYVFMYPVSGIGVNSGWLQFCGPLFWKKCQRHNRFRHWCLNYINNFHININVYC